jgi:hypothetical protein
LLGIEIFDFMRSKIFPFLFQWEGGCGGAPPFNNVHTAAGMIWRFRGGRAKKGIVGIMDDSNKLQKGEIGPSEAFFTKNLNLAMSGDSRWLTIRSELERRKEDALEGEFGWDTAIREEAERTLPPELTAKGVTIDPADAYTGVCLSYLREKGYITTEMDLVERHEAERRLKAIWGPIPMKDIEDQIALRKKEYLKSFHEELTLLAEARPNEVTHTRLKELEDPFSPEGLAILADYYKLRVQEALKFNSFIYNERKMVFKSSDVEEYYQRGVAGIRDSFCESVGVRFRPEQAKRLLLPDERRIHDDTQKWIDSGPLNELLKSPIPTGVGPDDTRIARDFITLLTNRKRLGTKGALCIIISSDVQLVFSCQRILSHEMVTISKSELLALGSTITCNGRSRTLLEPLDP